MRTIESWLSEYGENHQHPTNKAAHFLSIPLIMMGMIGLIWSFSLSTLWIAGFAYVLFMFVLSKPMSIGICVLLLIEFAVVYWVDMRVQIPLRIVSIVIFSVGWIIQFIGHTIEGRRPAFMSSLVFLLLGPAWTLAPIYRLLKIKL